MNQNDQNQKPGKTQGGTQSNQDRAKQKQQDQQGGQRQQQQGGQKQKQEDQCQGQTQQPVERNDADPESQ